MRPSIIVIAMSMLAACGGLAYLHAKREQAAEDTTGASKHRHPTEATVEQAAPANAAVTGTAQGAAQASQNAGGTISNEPAVAPETLAQWIENTESTDPKTRAAAIAALADAPRAVAMPVLKRVVEAGEPNVDRHVALRSMYSIALRDGDSTGEVRDTMRHAIYHGDDDGVTQDAQSLLDDIEAEFAQRRQDAKSTKAVPAQ